MLYIESAAGGLRISRWNGTDPRPIESVFVAESDLAALIAELLAHATDTTTPTADAWDAYAWLCGNNDAPAPT